MLRTYLLTAIRSLKRDSTITVINVIGMAVGLACCLLIGLFVHDELRYDRHHEHSERIVRIVSDLAATDTPSDYLARTSRPVADALRDQYPSVERAVRLVEHSPSIRIDGEYRFDHTVFYAENEIFEVFTFPLIEGDSRSALRDPNTAVVTSSFASRLFGHRPALGQTLVVNDSVFVTITAVLEDPPSASHLQFDLLISYPTYETLYPAPPEPAWLELNSFTYVLLRPGTEIAEFRAAIRDLAQTEYAEVLESVGVTLHLDVEPLRRIHLYSDRMAQLGVTSDAGTVGLFGVIAALILLIACVNYVNLATARSMRRAREVGVRKALGAGRPSLVWQFLSEATLLTAFAMAVAVVFAAMSIGWFNTLSGKNLSFEILAGPGALAIVALTLTVGILAGLYPALVLSRSEAADVIRGAGARPDGGAGLRRVLVILQFAASIVLIAATLATVRQLDHMRSQDLGFEPEGLIVVRARNIPAPERARRFQLARKEIADLRGVRCATASATTPGDVLPLLLTVGEGLADGESRRMHYVITDEHFAETYRLRMAAGRMLSPEIESDVAESVLVNRTAVRTFGWDNPEDALGRWIRVGAFQREVVGVFEDYHHFSLRQPVEPTVMMVLPGTFTSITARVDVDHLAASLNQMRDLWHQHFPGYSFSYSLVSDAYEAQYDADRRLSIIMSLFAGLAILVASLGLFGLVAYTTSKRRKEIGVRKTMGAGVGQIIVLLMKSVVGLVAIAIVVAVPLAYVGLRSWLDGFPYPATLAPSIFIVAGLIVFSIATVTVSSLAARAATADPTKALRSE
jgi:putative ABC transport system permease protein